MKTATGFFLGATLCFGFLTGEPLMSLIAAVGLLLALAWEFGEEDD